MPATCTNLTLDLPGTWWAILVYASRYMGPATRTGLMLNLQGTNVCDPGVLQFAFGLLLVRCASARCNDASDP